MGLGVDDVGIKAVPVYKAFVKDSLNAGLAHKLLNHVRGALIHK